MSADEPTLSRRRLLITSGSLGAFALAGCLGGDDDDGSDADDSNDDQSGGNGGDDDTNDTDDTDTHDGHDDGHDVDAEPFDHIGIGSFSLLDRSHDPAEEAAWVHDDHWDGNLPQIPVDESISLGAVIEDDDGEPIELGDAYELRAALAHDAPDGVVSFESHGDHVSIAGETVGVTDVVFQIWHDDHADYQSPEITAQVVEEVDEDGHDHDDHDDHDHDDHDHDDHDHDDHDHDDHDHDDHDH
ncbi:hypothetical protein ACLI4Q_09625 [Natrialbaceae archaeon A-CW1-1]